MKKIFSNEMPNVEIINKEKPKKAPFIFKGVPNFNTTYEKERYWDTQYKRWIDGYNGLTGRHYFYLTMGALKPVTGMAIHPVWRDGDHEVFLADEESRKYGQSFAVIKRREFGLTSIYGGNEPIYNCLINPGSINLLTSADKTRVKNMFSDKTMFYFDHLELPETMKPKKKSERQEGFLNLGGKAGGVGAGSQVYCLETADNDKNAKRFETFRAMSIFLDEWFLHPRATIVYKSSQACLKQSFETIGHMVLGGSCGGETEDEVQALKHNSSLVEDMINDADALEMKVMFIPGWLCINGADEIDDNGRKTGKRLSFMENGYSSEAKATEWIMKRRSILEKAKDKSHFYNFVKSYPLTIDEVFQINKMGILPPDVYASLDVAKKETILTPEKKISLRRDSVTQNISVTESNKGLFFVAEEPKAGFTYISGTDPIPLGPNISEEGSQYANVIYCLEEEKPVAYLAERNLDADALIRSNIVLQEWYRSSEFPQGAPTMMEYNRGEVAMRIYKELGKDHLLADRPKNLGIIYEESIKGKKGWYSNDRTIARANNYLVKNLTNYADRIRLLRMIEECAKFPNGNLDLLDAYKSMLIYYTDYHEHRKKTQKVGTKFIEVPYIGIDSNGRRVTMWRKKEIK